MLRIIVIIALIVFGYPILCEFCGLAAIAIFAPSANQTWEQRNSGPAIWDYQHDKTPMLSFWYGKF